MHELLQQLKRLSAGFYLGIIIFFGAVLRLFNINVEELWYDEIFGIQVSLYSQSFSEIAAYAKETFFMPLYYSIFHYWLLLFGNDSFSARFFSVLFSVLNIPLLYILGRKLFNKEVGLLAAFLMAFSPLHVEYGQEARPYSLLLFIGLLSMITLWNYLKRPADYRMLIVLTLSNIVGVYTHFDYWILISAQIGLCATFYFQPRFTIGRPTIRNILISTALIPFITFIPWLIYAIVPSLVGIGYAIERSAPTILPLLYNSDLWFSVAPSASRLFSLLIFFGQVAATGVSISALYVLVQRYKNKQINFDSLLPVAFIVIWYIAGALFYINSPLSAQYTPKWQRHVLLLGPPLLLLTSYALLQIRKIEYRYFLGGCIIISMLVPLTVVVQDEGKWSKLFRNKATVEYIEKNEQPGDLIFVPGGLWEVVILYYYDGVTPVGSFLPIKDYNPILDRPNYYLPSLKEAHYAYKRPAEDVYVGTDNLPALVESYKRVWFLIPQQGGELLEYFLKNWNYVGCQEDECEKLYLFERR